MMPAIVPGLTPLALVAIDAGTFAMGSTQFEDAQPVTNVTVSAFEVSETKVTIGAYQEYLSVIGDNRVTLAVTNSETGDVSIVARGKTQAEVLGAYVQSLSATMSPGARIDLGGLMVFEVTNPVIPDEFKESLDQPMVKIDWWEMLAFAAAHGGDLPTEAEYERVQRGRSGKDEYGTYAGDSLAARDGRRQAQYRSDRTSKVKTFPANSWGVYDASGNVWTWTRSWYADSYEGLAKKNPRGPKHGNSRVLRGGSYYISGNGLYAAYRFSYDPLVRGKVIGGVVVWRSQDPL